MGLKEYLAQQESGDWLTPLMDAALRERAQPEHWEEPTLYTSPSMSHSPCGRYAQLGMLGHRDEIDDRAVDRMENGRDAHRRLTRRLQEAGALFDAEVRLTVFADGYETDELQVDPETHAFDPEQLARLTEEHGPVVWSGEADVLVLRPDTGTLHLGEIKTASRFVYAKLPQPVADPVEMARRLMGVAGYVGSYPRQLLQYVDVFRARYHRIRRLAHPISEDAFLLFENTDTQERTVRWVRADEALLREALRPTEEARTATAEGRLLEPPYQRRSSTCVACFRRPACERLRDGDDAEWQRVNQALARTAELRRSGP